MTMLGLALSPCNASLHRSGSVPVNLLAELNWTAGASTTLSVAGGRARGTAPTATNPRIYKGPISVTAGTTYRLQGTVYTGTLTGGGQSTDNLFIRMATTTGIADGTVAQTSEVSLAINQTFTPVSSGNLYFGAVGVVSGAGEYFEIDDNFSISEEA